jgi:GxxExxY protein
LTGSIDEAAFCRELDIARPRYTRQRKLPVTDKDDPPDIDPRMDLAVEVELKSVQALLPVPEAQFHTSLNISFIPVGLLPNFNGVRLIDGVRRNQ